MQVGFWGLYFYCYSAKNMALHSFWGIYNPQIEIVSPAETKQYFNIFILKNEMV